MFSSEFCEITKNNFFTEHLRKTASGDTVKLGKTEEKLKEVFYLQIYRFMMNIRHPGTDIKIFKSY